jgi:hypothetical protein
MGDWLSRIANWIGGFASERTPLDEMLATIALVRPMDTGLGLVRIGRDHDGGYLVPDDLGDIAACFSPGVGAHATFEQELVRRGIPCHLTDHSVDGPPPGCGEMSFERRFLGTHDSEMCTTLDSWVCRHSTAEAGDLLLQMDIQGAEYDVIPGISPALLRRFRIIVVEFHKLDWIAQPFVNQRVRACLGTFAREFVPVHLHPNNFTHLRRIGPLRVPRALEVTYLRKDRCRKAVPQTRFPHPCDRDNVPGRPSLVLPDEWFRDVHMSAAPR